MAGDTHSRLTSARRARRLAVAAVLACCAFGLAFIPSAGARRDPRRDRTPAGAGELPASRHTTASSGATASSGTDPSSESSTEPQTEAESQAQGAEPQTEGAEQPLAASPQSRPRRKGSEHRRGSGRSGSGHRNGSGRGRGGERETGAAHSHEPEQRGEATSPQGASSDATATTALAVAPPASGPAPTTSATSAAPATSPAATGTAKSGTGGSASRARHRPARPAHSRRGGSRQATPVAGAAGVLPAASRASASNAARRARGAPTSPHRAGATRARPSLLVTTITRIVGVVPTAVRALIAGLLALALALALRSRVAAVRAGRLERQRRQLLEDVGLLQAALLPVPPARLGPVGTSAAYQPAAGPGAGGDFYDVFALADGQLAVIVGDVSGHGRQALPHTALVRFTLRAYLEAGLSPRDAVQTAGAVLERQLGGAFVTVVAATYQPRERVLTYACAGHPPPVVLGGAPDARALAPVTVSASPPIGAGMRTGMRQTALSIPGRAHICFYTDGLTEARLGSELFGTARLVDTLAELGQRATAADVLARVAELADSRPDDMAACMLSVEGDDAAPAVLVEELELDRDEAASERTERFLDACGVERRQLAELIASAGAAAGRAGTVVLELRYSDGTPLPALRRDRLAYLHARQAHDRVAL